MQRSEHVCGNLEEQTIFCMIDFEWEGFLQQSGTASPGASSFLSSCYSITFSKSPVALPLFLLHSLLPIHWPAYHYLSLTFSPLAATLWENHGPVQVAAMKLVPVAQWEITRACGAPSVPPESASSLLLATPYPFCSLPPFCISTTNPPASPIFISYLWVLFIFYPFQLQACKAVYIFLLSTTETIL